MYLCLDGIDGAGKDLQADRLEHHLRSMGMNPLRVQEPDVGMPGGAELRALLKSGNHPEAHVGLFLANRMALQVTRILPAIQEGRPVLSVRSFASTLVYQREQGYPLSWLLDIHRQLPCKATHMILLDIDPEIALQRATRRPGHMEFYEQVDIQKRNRQRYLDLAQVLPEFLAAPQQVGVFNAEGTPDDVEAQIATWLLRGTMCRDQEGTMKGP